MRIKRNVVLILFFLFELLALPFEAFSDQRIMNQKIIKGPIKEIIIHKIDTLIKLRKVEFKTEATIMIWQLCERPFFILNRPFNTAIYYQSNLILHKNKFDVGASLFVKNIPSVSKVASYQVLYQRTYPGIGFLLRRNIQLRSTNLIYFQYNVLFSVVKHTPLPGSKMILPSGDTVSATGIYVVPDFKHVFSFGHSARLGKKMFWGLQFGFSLEPTMDLGLPNFIAGVFVNR